MSGAQHTPESLREFAAQHAPLLAENITRLCGSVITKGLTSILEEVCRIQLERDQLLEALKFYAEGNHFIIADEDAWDTVSGEPQNLWCDEAGTATIEDGSVAKAAIAKAAGQQGGAA
jgi:hypothetical protein